MTRFVDEPARGAAIAETLNRLPMVRWDRLVVEDRPWVPSELVQVYGWIDRQDGRSDFVVLDFTLLAAEPDRAPWTHFVTSSAEHSADINRLLLGGAAVDEHNDCDRVETTIGAAVTNAIRLEAC